jgi:transposase
MRARFVEPLCLHERIELAQVYRTSREAALVRRCHAVLLSDEGKTVPEIGRLLRVDQSAVHRWLGRFEAGGVAGLVTVWSAGRPRRWDESYEALLVEAVRHPPRWYGLEQAVWTCPLLAGYLASRTGVAMSAERVRVLLHAHGLHLKQPTMVPPAGRDPHYHPKAPGPSNSA